MKSKKIILTYFEGLHKVVTEKDNKRSKPNKNDVEPEHGQAFVTGGIVKKGVKDDEAEQPQQKNAGDSKRVGNEFKSVHGVLNFS